MSSLEVDNVKLKWMNEPSGCIPVKHVQVPPPATVCALVCRFATYYLPSRKDDSNEEYQARTLSFYKHKTYKTDCTSFRRQRRPSIWHGRFLLCFSCSSAFHLHLWSFCVWFLTSEALLWVLNRAQGLPWQPESLWQLEQLYCKDRGYGEKGSVPSHLLLLRLAKSLLPRDVAQGWGPRLHH